MTIQCESTMLAKFEGWDLDVAAVDVPRVRDLDVAVRGGLKQPRKVRELIERNRKELEIYGSLEVRLTVRQTSGGQTALPWGPS